MKKLKIISAVLAVLMLTALAAPCALAVEAPAIRTSLHAIIGDADTGRILYAKDAETAAAPASVTKMMVLLLGVEALERGDVKADEIITATQNCRYALLDNCSHVGFSAGEKMPYTDLLYCIALASACDGCNVLAERVGGSIKDFVKMMNDRAAELGCTGTHFADPHGLTPKAQHYTTAHDLFRIAYEGMKHELFAKLVGTAELTIPATNVHGSRFLSNSNALINEKAMYGSQYVYDGACGIKTGRTTEAGYCLVSAAERNDMRFITVVLHASKNGGDLDNFVDSRTMLDWGFENCDRVALVTAGDELGSETVVTDTVRGTVKLTAAESITATLLKGTQTKTEKKLIDDIGSAKVGDEVGEYTVYDSDGNVLGTTKLKALAVDFEPIPTSAPTPTPAPTKEPEDSSVGFWSKMSDTQKGITVGAVIAVSLAAVVILGVIERKRNDN